MIVSIHQPEHMPYLGYFHKMSRCDVYVILDDVQFTKNNFQNRNRIVSSSGEYLWLTVPIAMKGHMDTDIKDIRIRNASHWRKKYWKTIEQSYSKHPHFDMFHDELRQIVCTEYDLLIDFNMALIHFFRKHLNIENRMVFSSALDVNTRKSQRIIDICKLQGATTYLSGCGARDYMDETLFEENHIGLRYQQFRHPEYPSRHFLPYLSTLDLLMNCGRESEGILKQD